MADLAGRRAIERDTRSPNGGTEYLHRLLSQLVVLLRGTLSASERCQAGDVLARLGDPRFLEAAAYYLPDDAWIILPDNKKSVLGFIEIPAGSFTMGEEEDQHRVTLPTYYISCYPVTVAQFQVFMAEEREGELPNHPITSISWHEAIAYCQWLTERLREWQDTPEPLATLLRKEGWQVTLPSEAEWEKAARGVEGLVYPWGNEWQEDRANTEEARIDRPSTVGCFPQGASPSGCQDMAGNVWEWTRSLFGQYPYPTDPKEQAKREDLTARDDQSRVLRGGSFRRNQWDARCAVRLRLVPYDRYGFDGFRIVVRPCSPSEL